MSTKLVVWRLCPGVSLPTESNSGQSVCSGCGSEYISCGDPSALTKVTCAPRETTMLRGFAPLADTVMVVAVDGGPAGSGDELLQAAATNTAETVHASFFAIGLVIRPP